MTDIELILQSRADIAHIESLGQASDAMKRAQAIAALYKAKDEQVNAQEARKYYLQVARRAGVLLQDVPRSNGGRNSCEVAPVTDYQQAAEDAGVSRYILHTWQRLAEIPESVFVRYLEEPKYMWTEYTVNGLIRFASGKTDTPMTDEGLIKTIVHYVKRLLKEYPDARAIMLDELRRILKD